MSRVMPGAVLVNYAGYPSSLDSLMPDNGLASLAGSLVARGYRVRVLDYATPEMIEALVPARLRWRLRALALWFVASRRFPLPAGASLARRYQQLNEDLALHAERVQLDIARDIVNEVRRIDAAFVGFKLWTGAGQQGSLAIARRVKEALPSVKVFGGGPHVECFGADVLAQLAPTFDAVALGEGERTIVELGEHAAGLRPLSACSGVGFLGDRTERARRSDAARVEDLDDLPEPCYAPEVYPAMRGDAKLKLVMIDESRGCPYACSFCFHPVKSGRRRRERAPRRVADLMERLAAATGVHTFRLAGSNPSPGLRAALADELLDRGAPFEYVSFGHTRSRREPFERLRRSGCVSLFFGVESCSQEILERLDKRADVLGIHRNLREARRAGIVTTASLIVPCPFDSARTLRHTVQSMAAIRPHGVSVYLPLVVPGTAWFDHPERFQIRLEPGARERLMAYQVRFLMPPPFWDPLPYTISGRDHAAMVEEAVRVSTALDRRGVLTGVNDSLLLVARRLGISAERLRDLNRRMFMTADHAGITALLRRFNAAASAAALASRLGRLAEAGS
jgi:radical SAM superfamily enzyme YgiQ (UPF0313 family)